MARLQDLIQTYAASLGDATQRNWKSKSRGFSCLNEDGHDPQAKDLIEETEFKMTGKAICAHCQEHVIWVAR